MNSVLIIDDDVDTCTLLSTFLSKKGYKTKTAYSGNSAIREFREEKFDFVICDYRLGDRDGIDVLKALKDINQSVKIIIITGYSDIKTAVRVIKEGACDYISKPLIPEELLKVLEDCQQKGKSDSSGEVNRKNKRQAVKKEGKRRLDYVKGDDPAFSTVYKKIKLVAPTNYNIILYGESGTGKEVIARIIHEESLRTGRPFEALDCGTLSKELAGSALFGHVKGAFTGAVADKAGHFEIANGGTLLLDEVSNLSYDIQALLLRALQERKIKRIGGNKELSLDVRIIVASNVSLEEACRKGEFRNDLFHRLNEFSVVLPPLRERKSDIPVFAHYFLGRVKKELNKDQLDFGEDVMESLVNYPWPGNIRELKNVIRRSSLLATQGKILDKHLPWNSETSFSPSTKETSFMTEEDSYKDKYAADENLKKSASAAEFETIMNVLKQVNYNKSQAAAILNINRKTLYNKLRKFKKEFSSKNES